MPMPSDIVLDAASDPGEIEGRSFALIDAEISRAATVFRSLVDGCTTLHPYAGGCGCCKRTPFV